jgi:hypothetical protein
MVWSCGAAQVLYLHFLCALVIVDNTRRFNQFKIYFDSTTSISVSRPATSYMFIYSRSSKQGNKDGGILSSSAGQAATSAVARRAVQRQPAATVRMVQ